MPPQDNGPWTNYAPTSEEHGPWETYVAPAIKTATANPSAPAAPSAPERFAGSFTESFGMPADIKQWPKAVDDLTKGPIPKGADPTGGALNPAINIGKGIATASRDAAATGVDRFKQPGAVNKVAGSMDVALSGIPVIGPSVVKASEQFGKGDYAGGFGTMTGTAMQILSGDPSVQDAIASAPGKVADAAHTVSRGVTGTGDHPITQARKAWAKETLDAQAKHETKVADILAQQKDDTLEAYLDNAKKVKEQNEAHARKIADINSKHADAIAKVRGANAQAKSEFDTGQSAGQDADRHAAKLADDLPQIKEAAQTKARAAYPKVNGTVDSGQLHTELKGVLDKELRGTERAPASLGRIIADSAPKEENAPTVMGQKLDPTNPLHAGLLDRMKAQGITPDQSEPITFDKLHGYYSELGRELYERDLPGDEASALREARAKVLTHMHDLARSEGKLEQFNRAQEGWKQYENTFNNSSSTATGGSPIARALKTRDPITGKLRPDYVRSILSEPKANKVAQDLLIRYAPTDSLKGLASATETAKAAPKKLKVAPEPAAPKMPDKPSVPSPKLPAPPDFPDRPQVEPFDAQKRRADMLEKAATKVAHMSPWEWRAAGAGALEMLLGQFPYAWSYPATMRARSILMGSPRIRAWIAAERPEWIKGSGSAPAISPLTQPGNNNQLQPPPARTP